MDDINHREDNEYVVIGDNIIKWKDTVTTR